jgi:hypothetical protein
MVEMSETDIRNAEQACQTLCVEYAEIVDRQDYGRLGEIFVPDALFARPTNVPDVIRGVDNIIAMFTSRPRERLTHHIMSNIRVRIETPAAASGTCRVLLFTSDTSEPETPEGRKVSDKQLMGTYIDRYVRTKNGWRFAERRGGISFHT